MNRKVACKEARQVFKKLICIGVLFIVAFSFSGCVRQSDESRELAKHKISAKEKLEAYAEARGEENYYVENWAEITGLITEGKAAIDGALNKTSVDAAVTEAKSAIDGVWTNFIAYRTATKWEIENYADKKGQQNYSAKNWAEIVGLVTKGKATINSALNKTVVDAAVTETKNAIDFVCPKNGYKLDEALKKAIAQDYLQEFGTQFWLDVFYGLYNGAAVFFERNGDMYGEKIIVSGVKFSFNEGWRIFVWKEGRFYNIKEIDRIFEEGVLTQSDVERLGVIHVEIHGVFAAWD